MHLMMVLLAHTQPLRTALLRPCASRAVRALGARACSSDAATAPAEAAAEPEQLRSTFLETMRWRGFLHQSTDLAALDDAMSGGRVVAYLGFDATASSLHVGSLLQIMLLRHFQRAGHKPIVLVGGGTTKVGDPSGKDSSRRQLSRGRARTFSEPSRQRRCRTRRGSCSTRRRSPQTSRVSRACLGAPRPLAADAASRLVCRLSSLLGAAARRFLTFGEGPTDALLVNNDAWLSPLSYLAFLRDYGRRSATRHPPLSPPLTTPLTSLHRCRSPAAATRAAGAHSTYRMLTNCMLTRTPEPRASTRARAPPGHRQALYHQPHALLRVRQAAPRARVASLLPRVQLHDPPGRRLE